jgi:hypothetical protein
MTLRRLLLTIVFAFAPLQSAVGSDVGMEARTTESLGTSCIYSESFSASPGWTSLAPSYAYWDSAQGNYYVRTRDNMNAAYYANSPAFSQYDGASPLVVTFDVMFESPNWGTYPGFRLTPQAVNASNLDSNWSVYFLNEYTDATGNVMTLGDTSGHAYRTGFTVSAGTWYRVQLDYSGSAGKLRFRIWNRSSGAVLTDLSQVDFWIAPFRYVGAGYYGQPDYGSDWSPIRIDNINVCVTTADSPPQVSVFSASPSTITAGQSSTLSWSSTGGSSASISGVGSVPTSGSVTVSPTQTTTYTLTVTGSGGTATRQVKVTVDPVATSAVLSLPGNVPLCSGQSVTVPVSIGNGSGTQALEFDVVYDASKMTATGATAGNLTGGFSVSSNVSYGRIRVAMASGSSIGSSSGEVAKVTFRGEAGLSPGSSTSISIQNVKVNDASASGGSATVTCASCRRGDVNGNGAVTAFDASLILQAVVGAISLDSGQQCAADFNQNGSVTAFDASLILQCVVTGTCP